ncbi:MAG: hypothetical protein ABI972_01330 [Acidobacteriota bacterium]
MKSLLTLFILAALPSAAIEIATGKMLGSGYDARAFYVRAKPADAWKKTYTGGKFKPEAAGRLMNLRVTQALFHDEWLTEYPFDPEKNTDRVIAALDTYKAHGILAVNVSLQSGNPGYNKEQPLIKRDRAYKLGPGKGMHTSAFLPDGSLKPAWMARLKRLQTALDKRGMILNLMYFYQSQDEIFPDTASIERATANATDWLIENDCRNVVIDIANEFDIRGWDHDYWIKNNLDRLMGVIRGRFREKKAAFAVPISSSTGSSMALFPHISANADLTMIHGNNKPVALKGRRTAELAADATAPGPIFMNEDDSGRETTPAVLKNELASCDAVFQAGGSWGYMPWRQTQMYPFKFYMPAKTSKLRDGMTLEESDPVYFKAVLEHIRGLVMKQ